MARLFTREEYPRPLVASEESGLRWLLGFGQGEDQAPALDRTHAALFVADYLDPTVENLPDLVAVRKLAGEAVGEIRQFVAGDEWRFPVGESVRVLEAGGRDDEYRTASLLVRDFETAFRLRASDLAYRYWGRIRTCARGGCKRLFVAADNRQVFCSRRCTLRMQYERRRKIGEKRTRRKKHREQYHQRKEAKDNGTKTQRG